MIKFVTLLQVSLSVPLVSPLAGKGFGNPLQTCLGLPFRPALVGMHFEEIFKKMGNFVNSF